jgi:hypothetical protein
MLELFNWDPVAKIPRDHVSIIDMGLIWRPATPASDDCEARNWDGEDYAWKDYLDKICAIVCSRHSDAELIIMVNDQ